MADIKSTPSSQPVKACVVCQSSQDLKACASCLSVWYCNKEHQVSHWKLHKPDCLKLREDTDLAQQVARMKLSSKSSPRTETLTVRTSTIAIGSSESKILATKDEKLKPLPRNVERPLDIIAGHLTLATVQQQSKAIVTCLNKYGIAVINNFVGIQLSTSILDEVRTLDTEGVMEDGQTTLSASEESHIQKYRTDKITWVNGMEPDCRNIGILMNCVDSIVKSARADITDYKIHGRTQAMVACYPGRGTGYVRHVDNPNKDGRCLTCIYYLNKDWSCRENGGMLKIYPEGSDKPASIEPVIDRLLLFWSDARNPHEVLPAYDTRYAVTVWYFDQDERTKATVNNNRKPAAEADSENIAHEEQCET